MSQYPFRTYTNDEIEAYMGPGQNPEYLVPPVDTGTTSQTLEIGKMLTLSTAHLSRETREKMDDPGFIDQIAPAVYPKTALGVTYGWFVYTARYDGQDDEFENIPDDLKAAIELSNDLNCQVICFDAEATPVQHLPTYDD